MPLDGHTPPSQTLGLSIHVHRGRSFNRCGFDGKDLVGRSMKNFGLDLDVRENFLAGCGRGEWDKLSELLRLDALVNWTVDEIRGFDTVEPIRAGRFVTPAEVVFTFVPISLFVGVKEVEAIVAIGGINVGKLITGDPIEISSFCNVSYLS